MIYIRQINKTEVLFLLKTNACFMFKKISLSLLFVFATVFCHAQIWVPSIKSGETGLSKVVFQDKDTGYAVSSGKVLRTTDAGKTWNRILSSYKDFGNIFFADKFNGCIVGENDLVLITSDGGVSWQLKRTGNSDDDFMTVFMKGDTLFIVGPDDIATNKFAGYVNISYDRGNSWSRKSTGSTQTMRCNYAWNKDVGLIGTLTSGVFKTTNGWNGYNVVWPSPSVQITDMAVIKDSVIVIVGNNGKIGRSNNYGQSYTGITSPTSSHLISVDFANDTFGMACGFDGTILITRDGGLSWTAMTTGTKQNFYGIHVINPFYAFAVCNSHADSFNIFKFGSDNYIADKINFISGYLSADLDKDCKKDNVQRGPSGVLVKVTPGPYYTYTETNGKYQIALPDTGTFSVECTLPKKYIFGKGQCQTTYSGIYFSTFEKESSNNNFLFESDTSVNLEIKVASDRKRRCANNEILINYKNIGFNDADSVEIKLFYPDELLTINNTSKSADIQPGQVTFQLGKLKANEQGQISITDSVRCIEKFRGRTVCLHVVITPKILVKNTTWDTSWVTSKIICKSDSVAVVKILNAGKDMKDSALLKLYLDDELTGELKYRIPEGDSLRFEIEKKNKTVVLTGDIANHHPYQEKLVVWKETCGQDSLVGQINQITKFQMQEFPSFEAEICLPIRDSYDPNDITVTPSGIGSENYISNFSRLNYKIRFQNTGTDTAYNVHILDTLPIVLNESTIEFTGSSHKYKTKLIGDSARTILRIDFNDIYLVDSFTNEPGSNGWISFDIVQKNKLPHRKKIENFVDIYFDFNSPVRTNTALVTIYDTIIKSPSAQAFVSCASKFTKKPENTVVCNVLNDTLKVRFEGKNKPWIYSTDTNFSVSKLNDTTYAVAATQVGNYTLYTALEDCDLLLKDSAVFTFSITPTVQLTDSLHCNTVSQLLTTKCWDCNYTWNDNSKLDYLLATKAGNYFVQLQNKCGMATDTAIITMLPYLKLNLGNDTLVCDAAALDLKSNINSPTINWWDNTNSLQKTINKAGKYWLNYQDPCNDLADTMLVEFGISPQLDLGRDTGFCGEMGVELTIDSLGATDRYIIWDDDSRFFRRNVAAPGFYSARLGNRCGVAKDTIWITQFEIAKPNFDLVSICTIDNSVFRNLTDTLGGGNLSYQWNYNGEGYSDGFNGQFGFKNKGDKTIQLKVTTSNGCVDSTAKIFVIDNRLYPQFLAEDVCSGDTAVFINNTIGGDSTIEYFWRYGDGNSSNVANPKYAYGAVNGSKTFLVTLVVKLGDNCRDSITKPITINAPTDASFTIKQVVKSFVFTPISTDASNKYFWDFGDGNTSTNMIAMHQFDSINGIKVCLKIVNAGNCKSEYCFTFETGDAHYNEKLNALIYPNPTSNKVFIQMEQLGNYSLSIFDAKGGLINNYPIHSNLFSVEMESYTKGIYFFKIADDEGRFFIKRVVKD